MEPSQSPNILAKEFQINQVMNTCEYQAKVRPQVATIITELLNYPAREQMEPLDFFTYLLDPTIKGLGKSYQAEQHLQQVIKIISSFKDNAFPYQDLNATFRNILPAIIINSAEKFDVNVDLIKISNPVIEILNHFRTLFPEYRPRSKHIANSLFSVLSLSPEDTIDKLVAGHKKLLNTLKDSGYSGNDAMSFYRNTFTPLGPVFKSHFSKEQQFELFVQSITNLRELGLTPSTMNIYFSDTLKGTLLLSDRNNIGNFTAIFEKEILNTIRRLSSIRYSEKDIFSELSSTIPQMAVYGFLNNTENLKVVGILSYNQIAPLSFMQGFAVDPYSLIATALKKDLAPMRYAKSIGMDLRLMKMLYLALPHNNDSGNISKTFKICNEIYTKVSDKLPYSVIPLFPSLAVSIYQNASSIREDSIADIVDVYAKTFIENPPTQIYQQLGIAAYPALIDEELRYINGALEAASSSFSQMTYMSRKVLGQDGSMSPVGEFLNRIALKNKQLPYKYDAYPGNGFFIDGINQKAIEQLVCHNGELLIPGADDELSKISSLKIIHFRGFVVVKNLKLDTGGFSLLVLNDHYEEHVKTDSLFFMISNAGLSRLINWIDTGSPLPNNMHMFLTSLHLIPYIEPAIIDLASIPANDPIFPDIYYYTLPLVKSLWIYNLAFSQFKKGHGEELTDSEEFDPMYKMYHIALQAHEAKLNNTELRITNTYFGNKHLPKNLPAVDIETGNITIDSKPTGEKFSFDDIEKDLEIFARLFFPFWASPHLQLNITAKE